MQNVSISDRRKVMANAANDTAFADRLRSDPRTAFTEVTGVSLPGDICVRVFDEVADAWEFVIPSGPIDPVLPEAGDARTVVENDVYRMLRDEPHVKDHVVRDPVGFLADIFQFHINGAGINVREESADDVFLIIPHADARDELSDDALDLVAGGGDPGQQSGATNVQRSSDAPKGR